MNTEEESMLAVGQRAQLEGRFPDAERAFRAVLDEEPANADALHLLGVNHLMAGKADAAVSLISNAIEEEPQRADFHSNLGVALKTMGQLQPAADALSRAIALSPGEPKAYQVLGDVLFAANDLDRAGAMYRKALECQPDSLGGLLGLGKTLELKGDFNQAEKHLSRARRVGSEHPETLFCHASVLYRLTRLEEALALFESLMDRPRYRRRALISAATIELEFSHPDLALRYLGSVEEEGGREAMVLSLRAAAMNILGERAEAISYYREALSLDPGHVMSWYELAKMAPEVISNQDLAAMEKLVPIQATPVLRAQLYFAQARVFEHRRQWGAEIHALQRGNAEQSQVTPFNRERVTWINQRLQSLFSRDWYQRASRHGREDVSPLFIIGMPRSGTTLTEQILSSHSRVQPTAESRALARAIQLMEAEKETRGPEAILGDADSGTLSAFAAYFLDYARDYYEVTGEYFTDKSMENYRYLPLLAAAFPAARFIRVRRDPLDLAFGCYRQLFAHGQYFAYEPESIAFQMNEFESMVDHWLDIFPEVPVYELHYASLVADQREETRRLLAFCGLEWEHACLNFQDNRRVVVTASQNQVRQGMNREGLGRGGRYGQLLDSLRDALHSQGITWRE